jgi:hypothetical protein
MQPRDPDDEPREEESTNERKLLDKLKLTSFVATPPAIRPFEKSTLSWQVVVPASVSNAIRVTFTLGEASVAANDSFEVSPTSTSVFFLFAHSPLTSRQLGSKVVQVDTSDCKEGSFPRGAIAAQAQPVKDLFRAGSLSSRGVVEVEMQPPSSVRVKVPLAAAIENFFDADIDVALEIRLSIRTVGGGNRVASAELRGVSVDVSFTRAEHILSVGTAAAVQSLVEPFAADLIKSFIGPQIETTVARPLQQGIDTYLALWRGADPAKRTYRLYSITADPSGLIVVGCPVPAVPGTGGGPGGPGNGVLVASKARSRRRR